MKFTYLIGNGFDLNIGLKSSFKDFIKIYSNPNSKDSDVIKKFKTGICSNISLWSDFEFQMGRYTQQVMPIGELSVEDYFDCIENFREELVTYLNEEEKRLDRFTFCNECDAACHRAIEYPFQYMRLGSRNILENYLLQYITESIEYNFIVFNYTHTFDDFLTPLGYNVVGDFDDGPRHWERENDEDSVVIDKIGKVIHVHGELGNAILLGLNDSTQVVNQKLAANEDFQCNYIKPISNKMLDERQDEISIKTIKESDIIFIYGMSIGETDKMWWETIMEWLNDEAALRERFLVVFSYDNLLNRNSPLDNIKNQREVVSKLLSFSSDITPIRTEYILRHVFCSLNSDIFKLDFNPFRAEKET